MKLAITHGKRGFYWAFRSANGRVLARGGEPFVSRSNAIRAFKTAKLAIGRFGFYGIVWIRDEKPTRRRR